VFKQITDAQIKILQGDKVEFTYLK